MVSYFLFEKWSLERCRIKIVTWGSNSSKFSMKEVTSLGLQIVVTILYCENGVYLDEKFGHI